MNKRSQIRTGCTLSLALMALRSIDASSQSGDFAIPVPSAIIESRSGPTDEELRAATRIVMLGTGTPIPDAHRAGPSIALIHHGEAYLFDVGAGSIQNAVTARYKYDIPSLYPSQICCVFLSHLHSDHTMDYSELAYTLWWRRREPLRSWGPKGLLRMNEGMAAMMEEDTALRLSGVQPVANPDGYKVRSVEILPGLIFEKDDLRIEAFAAKHGDIKPAYSFRVTTGSRRIVISGDTAFNDELLEKSRGVDILFHEVISDAGIRRSPEVWQAYHRSSHTPAADLGRLAAEAKPGTLVLYHGLFYGVPESKIVDEVKSVYGGKVVLANDLDIF